MKLFHSPASPFVRKVMVLLHELDRADAVELASVVTTALASDEALKAANPLARLPALTRPDGATLYDSRVITAYLNDLFGGGLYPQTAGRWEVLTLEATGDGIMDSAVSMVYEKRLRPDEKQSAEWVEAQWAKIARALRALDTLWMSHLSGPVSMGHVSVGCALGYLDFRLDARNWRHGNDALAAWFERFDARPAMVATRPPAA